MDKERCQTVQRRLTAGENLSVEERRHLEQCHGCASVARLCRMLSPEEEPRRVLFPDAALDKSTLEACGRELRRLALKRRMRMFFLPVAAAAALVVLLGVSLATGHRRGAMPAQQPLGEALAVAQVDAGELVSPEMVLDTSVMLTNDELDDFNAELALALLSDAW